MGTNFELNMNDFLPLRDVVFNTLRQAILRGELQPGERLLEIHLANKLGVSRTPIREAIRKLELEGLVLMIPRKGAVVAEITEKSLRDVLEVRRALEELAVKLACDKIQDEEIEELKAKLNTQDSNT
jgi:DNA-binding GntR family transcriptional regulator